MVQLSTTAVNVSGSLRLVLDPFSLEPNKTYGFLPMSTNKLSVMFWRLFAFKGPVFYSDLATALQSADASAGPFDFMLTV